MSEPPDAVAGATGRFEIGLRFGWCGREIRLRTSEGTEGARFCEVLRNVLSTIAIRGRRVRIGHECLVEGEIDDLANRKCDRVLRQENVGLVGSLHRVEAGSGRSVGADGDAIVAGVDVDELPGSLMSEKPTVSHGAVERRGEVLGAAV